MLARLLFFAVLCGALLPAMRVTAAPSTCPYCRGNFRSCNFDVDGKCPTKDVVAANARVLAEGAGKLVLEKLVPVKYLRSFTRVAMDSVMSLLGRPAPGTTFDIDIDTSGPAILTAIGNGLTTVEAAVMRILELIDAETDDLKVSQLKGRLEGLKILKDSKTTLVDLASASCLDVGVYTFIWYKVSEYVMKVRATISLGSVDTGSGSSTSSRSGLSATLHRPRSFTEFAEMLNMFILFCQGLAVLSAMVLTDFFESVVFDTIRLRNRKWQVAHEMLLVLFRKVEDSGGQLTLCQSCEELYLTSVLEEAEHKAATFFRSFGGNPKPDEEAIDELGKGKAMGGDVEAVVWNGKDTPSSSTCCPTFNSPAGRKHPRNHLRADGTCRFRHVCNKWVSNKGTGGRCFGEEGTSGHNRFTCDNPHRCDDRVTN